jgi:hypothetical protein
MFILNSIPNLGPLFQILKLIVHILKCRRTKPVKSLKGKKQCSMGKAKAQTPFCGNHFSCR